MPKHRKRYWPSFKQMSESNENIWNSFPMFMTTMAKTTKEMLQQLKDFNDKYADVPDPAYVAAMHFNKLIILLLRDIPKLAPTVKEEELKL